MKIAFHFVTVFFTLFATIFSLSQAQDDKPKVEIYYETLQVNVRQFFIQQFRVVSENLLDKIDLRLYPYGNTENEGGKYTCKSILQCEVNAYHGCMIKGEILSDDQTSVDQPIKQSSASSFVLCYFKNKLSKFDAFELGEYCFPKDAKNNFPNTYMCASREKDKTASLFETVSIVAKDELEKNNGLAVRVASKFIDLKTTSLVGAICEQLKDDEVCAPSTKPSSNVNIVVYYEALNSDASKYLAKQLGNFYHVIEDLASIELVPYGNTVKNGDAYDCHQGAAQCMSNKFQALVVNKYITNSIIDDLAVSGRIRVVKFLQCLAQSPSGNEFTSLETCSTTNLLDKDDYANFMNNITSNSTDMVKVFESMRTKTEEMLGANNITLRALPRVPTVTLNGQLSYNALNDLLGEACAQQWMDSKESTCSKTKVTILYEPLNHQSRSLFLEQLNSIFNNLFPLLDVELIPAGRTNVTENGLSCSNGNNQCIEMQLQACALDYYWKNGSSYSHSTKQDIFDLIWCTFKNRHLEGVMNVVERCANDHIALDPWNTIYGCYVDGTGKILVADNIKKTQDLIDQEYFTVPTVYVNKKNVTGSIDIKKEICALYDVDSQPDYCKEEVPKKVSLSVYYESTSELSKHFFTTQYGQWYTYLEEIADIQLYPAGNILDNDNGTCDSYENDSGCMANKLMAVIIDTYSKHPDDGDFIDGTLRTMLYHRCYYNHPHYRDNIYDAAEYCVENFLPNDEWTDLEVLAKTPAGGAIYAEVLKATQQVKEANKVDTLSLIPWVTVEGDNNASRMAMNDLLQTVCERYTGSDRPLECKPVEVTVFYSARHAQSRRFIVEQLQSVYWHLRERIQLQLVPYGMAKAGQTIYQECELKADNCTANVAQACAIKLNFDAGENTAQWDSRNQTLTFINCLFKNINNEDDSAKLAEDCANTYLILGEEVMQCVGQGQGWQYLTEMRDLTLKLGDQLEPMEHAPWILINGLRSAKAQSDLKGAICDAMLGDKPDFCLEATLPKVKMEFHYSALNSKVQQYVLEELYPHYRKLEEIVDLDVIPFGLTDLVEQTNEDGTLTGNYTMYCINGIEECRVNMIHGCLYSLYYHNNDDAVSDNQNEFDGKMQFIEFLKCYFASAFYPSKIVDAAASCGEQIFKDAFGTALQCAQTFGQSILQDFEKKKVRTLLPHLKYIPWITVNGKHSYTIEHHIQRTICDSYQGTEKPQDCYELNDDGFKPKAMVHYEIGDAASKDFFAKLSDEWSLITTVADITLVPFGRSTYNLTKSCINNADCIQYIQHACLLNLFFEKHSAQTLKAIECTFGDLMNQPDVVKQCVNNYLEGIDENTADPWEAIDTCSIENGEKLINANEELVASLTPRISHVPWVIVNDEHDPEAEDSMMNEICGYFYPNDKPAACQPKPLEVAVYYETNNTGVAQFFKDQISTFTEYLDEFAQFSFIPYGTANTSDGQTTCESAEQCNANGFHACVINRYYNSSSVNPSSEYEKNRIRTAGFMGCSFLQEELGKTPTESAELCFNINFENFNSRDVLSCAKDGEGQELLAEMGRQTGKLNPPLTSAPVVTVSGVKSDVSKNFFQQLCTTYGDIRPAQCASLPSAAVKLEVYFSGNQQGFDLLSQQLYPIYKDIVPTSYNREYSSKNKVFNIIRPELVAWGGTVYNPNNTDNPFTCAGTNECYINRFFACAKHYHSDEPKADQHLMKLALCAANQSEAMLADPSEVFNKCTNLIWPLDPFGSLEVCATLNNTEYFDIFLKEKEKTDSHPEITSYPAVTLNNIVNANATQNLLEKVCPLYDSYNRPLECLPYETPVSTPSTTPTPFSTPSTTPTPSSTPSPPTTTPSSTPFTTPTPSSTPFTTPTPSSTPFTTPTPSSTPFTTPTPSSTPFTTPTPSSTPFTTPTPSSTPSTTPTPSSTPSPSTTPSTTPPGGSGTTKTVSIIVLLIAIILSQLLL